MHEADEPDLLVDLLDPHLLTGEHGAEVDLSFSEAELAWTNFKCQTRIKSHYWGGEKKRHPTMKPLALINWCINKAPDDVKSIFDPFAGSGTTLVAAKLAGINCVGCEREEVYCEIAADRLRQGVLFVRRSRNPAENAAQCKEGHLWMDTA